VYYLRLVYDIKGTYERHYAVVGKYRGLSREFVSGGFRFRSGAEIFYYGGVTGLLEVNQLAPEFGIPTNQNIGIYLQQSFDSDRP
jgi:hypothetical protein